MTASQTPAAAEAWRGAGLRVTAARVALLETVRDGDHLGVEAIPLEEAQVIYWGLRPGCSAARTP
jgi:Fe2+ or Zn2+ uptake regulation protein